MMRTHGYQFAACGFALAAVLFAGAAHAAEPYDVEVYNISVKNVKTGGTNYAEGNALQINCNWSVTKATATSSWPPMAWNTYVKVDDKTIYEGTTEISPPAGPKISKGFGWTWDAKGPGVHTITCGLGNPKLADIHPANNQKSAVIHVTALPKANAPPGPMMLKPTGAIPPPPNVAPRSTPPRQ